MSDPWTIQMRQPFVLDEYCLTTRESITYRVILDPDSSWPEVINAYVLDYHHKTTVLHPDILPWLYCIFVLILLIGLFGVTIAVIKQAEKAIKGIAEHRLEALKVKQPVIQERRTKEV